jgi:hypothetical protein
MKRTDRFTDEAPTNPAPSKRRKSSQRVRVRKPPMIIREEIACDLRKDARTE